MVLLFVVCVGFGVGLVFVWGPFRVPQRRFFGDPAAGPPKKVLGPKSKVCWAPKGRRFLGPPNRLRALGPPNRFLLGPKPAGFGARKAQQGKRKV